MLPPFLIFTLSEQLQQFLNHLISLTNAALTMDESNKLRT